MITVWKNCPAITKCKTAVVTIYLDNRERIFMFQNDSIYALMFTSGLFGGFGHCIGMCGPIVTSCSLVIKDKSIVPHLFYNLGRISTYAALGGIIGMTGSFIGIAGHTLAIQKSVMIFAGVFIVIMGMGLAGWLPVIKYIEGRGKVLSSFLEKVRNIISGDIRASAFYPAGILLGFIPCGLLYTALLTTARAGMDADTHFSGFLTGTLLMGLFGIGTFPAMLLFGKAVNIMSSKLRTNLYRLSAIVMIVMGLIFIVRAV
jgi:sulfite exporter TauE/SafE